MLTQDYKHQSVGHKMAELVEKNEQKKKDPKIVFYDLEWSSFGAQNSKLNGQDDILQIGAVCLSGEPEVTFSANILPPGTLAGI